MTGFDEATAVRRAADGRYAADLDPGYGFGEALNGGYLMATMLRASIDDSAHRHPVATSVTFLRVARPGPADVWVDALKSGRTTTVARVTLVQGDRPVVAALVTSGDLDEAAEPDWTGRRAEMPPVDECFSFESGKAESKFADQVDMRFDPAAMGWLDGNPSGALEMRAYFRVKDDRDRAPDALALALAVDALPPVALNTGAFGWAPTVELAWHMRAVPAPGWLAVHGSGRLVRDGWFDEEVEVWDSRGHLVAQSRQIARLGRPA